MIAPLCYFNDITHATNECKHASGHTLFIPDVITQGLFANRRLATKICQLTHTQTWLIFLQGVGAVLPGTGQKIEAATLRGVESHGMLCSAFDIGWSNSPDGVLVELPSSVSIGEKLSSQPPQVISLLHIIKVRSSLI